jgi:AcrR family transcriptional regulator
MANTTEDVGDERDGITALLWGQKARPTRGPKPALDIDRIARAGVRIADAEGLAAVSMQRVAGELDFTKMALYRYVAGKAELLAVMIDLAVGEPPDLAAVPGGWRPRLEEFARLLAAAWERHPWLPWATMGDRVMGPNEVGWIECAVGTLDGTALTGSERMDAVFVLCGHIRNTQSTATAGTQPWSADKRVAPAMSDVLTGQEGRFPALDRAVAEAVAAAGGVAHDNGREFGLRCLLDGLAAVIAARA